MPLQTMRPISKPAPVEAAFWNWFEQNEDVLFRFEQDEETILNLLACQLHNVHPHLTFELGPVENGRREFIISAGGIVSAFPAVIALADCAPRLPKWDIVKFRQRRRSIDRICINEVTIHFEDVRCVLEACGQKINVTLYFGDESIDRTLRSHLGFLLLDVTLGEYDVETRVGRVDFRPLREAATHQNISLHTLPETFDTIVRSMSN